MADRVRLAGVDVSKEALDAWSPCAGHCRFANAPEGWQELRAWLAHGRIGVVALEASGGYERGVIAALQKATLQVRRLNPLRVRRFAQARGRFAKTDRIDAETIAAFAQAFPEDRIPSDPERDRLAEALGMRLRTQQAITDCICELEHLQAPDLRREIERRRSALRLCLARLDKRIAQLIDQHPAWNALATSLRSVPGVGPVLASTLVGLLPELGRISRREIASLTGTAPFDDSSGRRNGPKRIQGGRTTVRNVLYMATLVAMRKNPAITAFAQRLDGKKPKVIIIACMRKMITILNAIARDNASWKPA